MGEEWEGRGKGGRNGRGRGRERAGTGCSRMGAECGRCSLKEGESATLMFRVLECQRRTGTTGDHARSSTRRVVGIKTRMVSRESEGKRYGADSMFREVFGEILF